MDFSITAEQQHQVEAARQYATERIAPFYQQREREERFDRATLLEMGGNFAQVGTGVRLGLAKFSPLGIPDPNWHPSVGDVTAIAPANGKVYVGGPFITIGAEPRFGFAIVNADGSIAQ